MNKRKLENIDELIINEFSVYQFNTNLRASVCLLKKIIDKYGIKNQIINTLKSVRNLQGLEAVVSSILKKESILKRYVEDEEICFEDKVINELRMQSIRLGVKLILNILIKIIEVDISLEELNILYSKISYNVRSSNNIQNVVSELTRNFKFETFLDMFVGRADLAKSIIKNHKNVTLVGNDINTNELFLAIINLYIDGELNWDLRFKDSIMEYNILSKNKYDLIVSEIPLLQLIEPIYREELKDSFEYGMPRMYMDYLAIQRMLNKLSSNGRAIVIVPNSTLFRTGMDYIIRRELIKKDMIETVITMPEKMYDDTMAQVNILMLSNNKSESRKGKIQFIDASKEYIRDNGRYIINQESIKKIVSIYENEENIKDISIFLTIKEMLEYHYSLFIWNKYKYKIDKQTDNKRLILKDVAKVIRGIQITKEKYDRARENGRTHYYINASDIDYQTGKITLREESLIKPEEKWIEKCEVHEGDLIVTMKGTSFKMGIANNMPKSIVSGNLMIIRTEGKYDPYVLKEYLESPEGNKIIKSIQRGTSISIINPDDLEEITIPNLDLEKQNKIREKIIKTKKEYLEKVKELEEKRLFDKNEIYKEMGMKV